MSGGPASDNQNLAPSAKNALTSVGGGPIVDRLFLAHPRSVGESYWQHQGVAFGVAGALLSAGLACLVHGLIPALHERTGSRAIKALHDRIVLKRVAAPPD